MFLSEWREFPSAPCLAGKKKKILMTARVSVLLKSRASLTCFRACFLPGQAKDLPAPRCIHNLKCNVFSPHSVDSKDGVELLLRSLLNLTALPG